MTTTTDIMANEFDHANRSSVVVPSLDAWLDGKIIYESRGTIANGE